MKKFKLTNKKPTLIAAIHFPPLAPYPDSPGRKVCLAKALGDIKICEQAGIDALILENNYDLPHTKYIKKETEADLRWLIRQIKKQTKLPLGLSLLWNDYPTALKLAGAYKLDFIRIPVFVDHIQTHYGFKIKGNPTQVKKLQKKYRATNVKLLCDIHVKHSKILNKDSIIESAQKAIKSGADAIILTGKWTGNSPNLDELKKVRKAVANFPIYLGSGLDSQNASKLLKIADGTIVATSLKSGKINKKEINLKPWQTPFLLTKTKKLVKTTKLLDK